VALAAIQRGVSVLALTRNPETAAQHEAQGIQTVVADLAGNEWHKRVVGRFDFGVNCVSSGGGGIDGYRRSYVDGMGSIAAWAAKGARVGTFVYTSSTSVYAQTNGARVGEGDVVGGGGERAELLLQAESIIRRQHGGFGRWFILRLAGLYGPERPVLVEQVRSGRVNGEGSRHLNLIHRDDAASAVWALLTARPEVANQIYNAADDGAAPVLRSPGGWRICWGCRGRISSGRRSRGLTASRPIASCAATSCALN
jgi:nucleoside-diphosphate-sugar epimerase